MPKRNGTGIALLADPTRRRIIVLLVQHPRRPKSVAAELGLSFAATSRQLDLLLDAGLVTRLLTPVDRRGRLYLIDPKAQARIMAWLAGTEVGLEHGLRGPDRPLVPAQWPTPEPAAWLEPHQEGSRDPTR